jgi:phage terminase large subunit-like protein
MTLIRDAEKIKEKYVLSANTERVLAEKFDMLKKQVELLKSSTTITSSGSNKKNKLERQHAKENDQGDRGSSKKVR